jgi:integrase
MSHGPRGLVVPASAYLFSNDPAHARPWNPDWVTHRMGDLARAAGVNLDIKRIRHFTASQMLAEGFDLGNTAARLGHSGGGATTLKHYADPVSQARHHACWREATADEHAAAAGGRRCEQAEQACAGQS